MQHSRSLRIPAMDTDRLRYSTRLLNRSLLLAALLLAGMAASYLFQSGAPLVPPTPLLALIGISFAWLAGAYLVGRWQRIRTAGAMVVVLALVVVALALYLFPASALALLPLLVLPVALAALLLHQSAVYLTAGFTLAAALAALVGASLLPPPNPGFALPTSPTLNIGVMAITLLLLALIIAPLRGLITTLQTQLLQAEGVRGQAEQARRMADSTRDDALEQARRLQAHLTAVANTIGDGLLQVDAQGTVTQASPLAQAIWAHVAPGEVVGQPLERVRAALYGTSTGRQFAEVVALPAESLLPAEGYTHVLMDRREQARFDRLRNELLGLLTDEMRNPLTSMVTALDLTLGQAHLPEDVDRVLIGARRSGQRLVDLVTILLEISQIEQNPALLRPAATSLRRIIEAGLAQMSPLAQQCAVTVSVEYGAERPVQIDAERMQRGFTYLLEYALRHSPPYSTVQVRTEQLQGSMLVRISDQGPGLSAAERDALFEQQLVSSERGVSALGLAFSKLVIEKHGGRLWPENNGGQGSSYVFSLPVA